MRRLALVVAYEGSGFHGWQRQPGLRTAAGELEAALAGLLGEEVRVTGAGRTDRGVHARGQVCSFSTTRELPLPAFAPGLGRRLPGDLRVRSAHVMGDAFDARRSATARRYAYRLRREDDVLFAHMSARPRERWAPDAWHRAVQPLVGTHDFTSFESAGSPRESKVCRVIRASWSSWEGGVALDIVADHFLYHMVRNIVGTALAAGRKPDPAGHVRAVLAARDRAAAGACAPPGGLILEQVFYPEGALS
jgi:tRNA pseudouridine38-40 synthase